MALIDAQESQRQATPVPPTQPAVEHARLATAHLPPPPPATPERLATAHLPPPPPDPAPTPQKLASADLPPLPPTVPVPAPMQPTATMMPPPPPQPAMPPQPPPQQQPPQARSGEPMIGPYRLVRELGRGGMGVVYLAVREDEAFTKKVALKLLRGDQVNHEFLLRFRNERQVLANLDHPNIARILDGGTTPEGMPFYVMEFCEGQTIDQYCGQFRLGVADRVKLFQQVCAAVHYLHENGVVHRDLKPGNILVSKEGIVKLLDFGIAKLELGTASGNDLTGSFGRLMTPGYASPEQMSGAPITRSTDVYSLGVILYFLMTGELPYEDPQIKMQQVLAGVDPPKPSTKLRGTEAGSQTPTQQSGFLRHLEGDLDHIIMKSLQRDPRHRYETALAFSEDLSRYLAGQSITARVEPITTKTAKFVKRNRLSVGLAAGLAIVATLGGWQALEQVSQREQAVTGVLDKLTPVKQASTAPAPGGGMQSEAAPIPTPEQSQKIADDVKQLRQAVASELAQAWQLKPGQTPERKALVQRSNDYLKSVEPQAVKNADAAFEVVQTHTQVAQVLESKAAPQAADRPAALESWNNAARVVSQAAQQFPQDQRFRQQMMIIGPRIQALGGVMPVWGPGLGGFGGFGQPIIAIPTQTATEIEARRDEEFKNRYGTPQEATPMKPPTDPLPIAPPPVNQPAATNQPAAPAIDRKAYTELKEKWFTVSTRVQTAE
ncbi:MAG: serine/threonine protein kinase, partial [Bryobacteraceae bacterium]|nr:serine/threonine protein kinase [Bryobacteraceae bacterium]